ncbi:MAG TPA: S9 family peptidase [Acidimicrobiales bacterium]|nr:S9 family peptidase [Acidimicrobiales bacterium]
MLAPPPRPPITAALCARGRRLGEPRLAPGGGRVAFVSTAAGRGELVVVDLRAPAPGELVAGPEVVVSSEPAPRGARPFGSGVFDWLPDGSGLVYAATDGGLWFQPVDGAPPRRLVEGGPAAAPAVSPAGNEVAYVVDTRHVAVAPLTAGGPWPRRLSGGADFCLDPAWSPDGGTVAWHEWDVPAMPWDAGRIVARAAAATGEAVTLAGGEGVAVQQPRYRPTGQLSYLGDQSGWTNLRAIGAGGQDDAVLADDHEHGGPAWGPGQRSFAWTGDTGRAVLSRNEGGFGSLVLVDTASGTHRALARGVHGCLGWSGGRLCAVRSGARTPTQVVVRHGADLEHALVVAQGPLAGAGAGAGAGRPVEPEPVRWAADDGTEIPGRLYRPAATGEGPPPLIAWVHGGPTGQMEVVFNPRLAYWLDRGWAVLVPDHRGSTGHGRAFTQSLAGRWGEADVADVAAGLAAAVARGWGDPRRLVAMGASAGGFTVLNLLAAHPERCAAGVDLYGVADLFELEETTHRFEAHSLRSLVGPLPDAAERYRARSPVRKLDRIAAPLLILHGDADPVVPLAQSRAVADGLRARGRTVDLHVYEGEGHGWSRPETVIDELERTEAFLTRHVLRRRSP